MKRKLPVILGVLILAASSAQARSYSLGSTGFDLSGDLAITFRELDKHTHINQNFRGDDPFSTVRSRLFVNKAWNENIEMALEFLYDSHADPRVQGAYFTFNNLFGSEALYAKVGLIPSPFGNYGQRSTYFNQNPLIGVPAMWHYKTPLPSDGRVDNETLLARKWADTRSIPPAYDACWDTGVSLHYESGWIEALVAITQGTLSNPMAYDNDGYQGVVTAGLHPTPGFRFGGSYAIGPWIAPSAATASAYDESSIQLAGTTPERSVTSDHNEEYPGETEAFLATAVGGYAEYSFAYLQLHSEVIWEQWEMPFLRENTIDLLSGYLEASYKLSPQWYLAARVDRVQYSKIVNPADGLEQTWGFDLNRIELGIDYRVIREGFIRLDYQATRYDEWSSHDVDLLALQFLFAF